MNFKLSFVFIFVLSGVSLAQTEEFQQQQQINQQHNGRPDGVYQYRLSKKQLARQNQIREFNRMQNEKAKAKQIQLEKLQNGHPQMQASQK